MTTNYFHWRKWFDSITRARITLRESVAPPEEICGLAETNHWEKRQMAITTHAAGRGLASLPLAALMAIGLLGSTV
jgi:hypothetical protein